jgi:hypothetical protein
MYALTIVMHVRGDLGDVSRGSVEQLLDAFAATQASLVVRPLLGRDIQVNGNWQRERVEVNGKK